MPLYKPQLSGASGAVEVGDFVRFYRDAPLDATSDSFDFEIDLADSEGTSVVVDISEGWAGGAGAWGSPAPKIAEAGTYAVIVGLLLTNNAESAILGMSVMDEEGNATIRPFGPGTNSGLLGGAGFGRAFLSFTGYLPEGAHLVPTVDLGASTALTMAMSVQKVG